MAPRIKRLSAALALAGAAVLVSGPAGPALRRLRRSWEARVTVKGRSMEPALREGDWLLVDPDAFRLQAPAPGELVVLPDPRWTERWLVKRVTGLDPIGWLELTGDRLDTSSDSRVFGAVDPATALGRPWLRYWPPHRVGRIG